MHKWCIETFGKHIWSLLIDFVASKVWFLFDLCEIEHHCLGLCYCTTLFPVTTNIGNPHSYFY